MNTIAIVTDKKDQYSETFIHNQIKYLDGKVVVFGGGYQATSYSIDRGKNWLNIPNKRRVNAVYSRKYQSNEEAIIDLLKHHDVKLVLAQFGPVGVSWMSICEKCQLPLIVHFHGFDAYRLDILQTIGQSYSQLFDQASAIIGVSNHMVEQLMMLGCDREKLYHIPYGVDTSFFMPVMPPVMPAILSCGRFVAKKGPLKTLQAFHQVQAKFDNLKLVMIGDGRLWQQCKIQAKHWGIEDRVNFVGVQTPEQVKNWMSRSAIFVQHSCTADDGDAEGLPLSILEAGACGLPVVASRHTGIVDAVLDGVTGYLFNEHDINDMAIKMDDLLANEALRQQMSKSAREHIVSNYALEKYITSIDYLISKIILNSIFKTK